MLDTLTKSEIDLPGVVKRGGGAPPPVTYSMSPNIWCYLVLISVINTLTKSEIDLPGVVNPPPSRRIRSVL